MRLVRYESDNEKMVGVKLEDKVFPTRYCSMFEFIKDGEKALLEAKKAIENNKPVEGFRLLTPVDHPGKVLCAGINYESHKTENPNAKFPKKPSFFAKLTSSIVGPDDEIVIPPGVNQVDYEVELAFVVGKKANNVTRDNALDYIFGYTVLNDVSARALQFELQHETIGKGIDTFCPIGPAIVTTDEIPDPSQLHVSSYVNGEKRQSSPTSDMLFDIPTLMESLTSKVTLFPGDVISTGTPAGIGLFRNPQSFLEPGDIVEVEVDKIGRLKNLVVGG
jgi:2-keto-4-pentenoate hydratase/2-oxohepta-3-ene-1,7-dioic acid hydratase in catechol pathway